MYHVQTVAKKDMWAYFTFNKRYFIYRNPFEEEDLIEVSYDEYLRCRDSWDLTEVDLHFSCLGDIQKYLEEIYLSAENVFQIKSN